MAELSLILKEASLLDAEEIKASIPPADLTVIGPSDDPESHNELATVLILALTPVVVTAITMWLLRTHQEEIVEYKVTARKPDGSETEIYLKINRSSSEAPKAQVIKQIAEALKVPEDSILAMAANK
jgi:hypothetical protein